MTVGALASDGDPCDEVRALEILFDVLGTLVRDPFFVDVPAFFGVSFAELLRDKHPTTWVEFELGRIDEDVACARFFRDERTFSREAFVAHLRDSYEWVDGMEAIARELSERGVRLHAFSNYPAWHRLIEEKLALSRYVRWSFVSCELGVRKPSVAAYERALATLGVPADSVLLIDDREENCVPARSLGMHAIRFESAPKLRDELRALRLLP